MTSSRENGKSDWQLFEEKYGNNWFINFLLALRLKTQGSDWMPYVAVFWGMCYLVLKEVSYVAL